MRAPCRCGEDGDEDEEKEEEREEEEPQIFPTHNNMTTRDHAPMVESCSLLFPLVVVVAIPAAALSQWQPRFKPNILQAFRRVFFRTLPRGYQRQLQAPRRLRVSHQVWGGTRENGFVSRTLNESKWNGEKRVIVVIVVIIIMSSSSVMFVGTAAVDGHITKRDVKVSVSNFKGCGEGGSFEVEQWTLAGVDHFMEEETSRAMFSAAVKWLMSKTREIAGESPS